MKDKNDKKARKQLQLEFGEHLKDIRKKIKMTGAELARKCDMERHHILRLERGETNPTLYTLRKVSDALGMSLDELLKGLK